MASLSTAIVTYKPDIGLLTQCLKSLHAASALALQTRQLSETNLKIIDNSIDPEILNKLHILVNDIWKSPPNNAQVIATQSNRGFGITHNIAITETYSDYHLVLNPDVLLEKDTLCNAIQFMEQHPDIALLTPSAVNENGNKEYLNKRHPGLLTLFIRGFAPDSLRNQFQDRIEHYEMRDLDPEKVSYDIPLASGCFMLFRTSVLKKLGGFSDRFFLYFEDYDLSIRTHYYGRIAYVPDVKITHYGGGAASKGPRHIFLFICSAITFFKLHGWNVW